MSKSFAEDRYYSLTPEVKERVVQIQLDHAGGGERFDQQNRQELPQGAHVPAGVGQEAVKGIVGILAHWIGEGQDSGDGVFGFFLTCL